MPVVVILPKDAVYGKTLSNMKEVESRGGRIIVVTDAPSPELEDIAWEIIQVPTSNPCLLPRPADDPAPAARVLHRRLPRQRRRPCRATSPRASRSSSPDVHGARKPSGGAGSLSDAARIWFSDREPHLVSIEEAIAEIRAGRMIVLMDDEDRENEGDICMAAEKVSPEAIAFMARYARGLICMPLTDEKLAELGLPMMVAENSTPLGTALHALDRRPPWRRLRDLRRRPRDDHPDGGP